jgi:DNA-binding LacI/PurR family transcriptional regulator
MALGLLRALHEGGRSVPDDVSVVGFDDIPEAPYFTPPLTTVRQPFGEMGRLALELLVGEMERGTRSAERVVIAPELVVRASTAGPPG